MSDRRLSFIAGKRTGGEGKPFRAINAITGDPLDPEFVSATARNVDQAAQAAKLAFKTTCQTAAAKRAELLRMIADRIDGIVDAIVPVCHMETALPEGRIRGETGRTTNQLRLFADLAEQGRWLDARIDTALPDRQPVPKPDVRSMLRPVGPVAVFGASNFPLAFSVAGGDTASALAAGCPVVVKAHPAHPGTSELVAEQIVAAVTACAFPAGTFSMVFDNGKEVGIELAGHPAIKAVGFTGSRAAGLALSKLAAQRLTPIPVFAEMGSINPIFILPQAMKQNGASIAEGLYGSMTLGVGQFCTNPGVILATEDDTFAAKMKALIQSAQPGCMLHPGITAAYQTGVAQLKQHKHLEALVSHADDAGVLPHLFTTDIPTYIGDKSLAEEIFGPTSLLVQYQTPDDLLDVVDRMEGQLTATVHGTPDELPNYRKLLNSLETKVGRVIINQFPTGVEVCHSMVHGGPYPATTNFGHTSVGTAAIFRFTRRVCYQNYPEELLPVELQSANPPGVPQTINGNVSS